MNVLDMVIIVIICFCLIRGVFRGLVKELASIVGALAGFYAAYTYYMRLSIPPIQKLVSEPAYLNILNFMVIFCAVFILVSILGVAVKYVLNIAFLGWLDRFCGLGFGFIKGVLVVSVLLIVFTAFLPPGSHFLNRSFLAPHVTWVAEKMAKVVSKDMKHKYTANISKLKKSWNDSGRDKKL